MPGVIYNDLNDGPLFRRKPLDLPPDAQRRRKTLVFCYGITCFLSGVVAFILLAYYLDESNGRFAMTLFEVVFGFLILRSVDDMCHKVQVPSCNQPSTIVRIILYVIFFIWLVISVLLMMRLPILLILVSTLCCISQITWAVSSFWYAKEYCQCKTCLDIRDVSITYVDKTLYFTEAECINSTALKEWFDIESPDNLNVGLQVEGGAIIHTFRDSDSWIQLLEGDYIVRLIDASVVIKRERPMLYA